jgi:AcrR family transcriptional regulator
MTSNRRIGAESSQSRAALLDAAEQLMVEQGHAAVTSRRVASRAGLKPQLVHYYFRTMDDLYLEVFRRRAEEGLERQAEALRSAQPLRALWAFSNEPGGSAVALEFAALARQRPAIRSAVGAYAEQFRTRQLAALTGALRGYGVDADELPPVVLLVLMTSLSRMLVLEEGLDMSMGHHETRELVERWITRVEGPA